MGWWFSGRTDAALGGCKYWLTRAELTRCVFCAVPVGLRLGRHSQRACCAHDYPVLGDKVPSDLGNAVFTGRFTIGRLRPIPWNE